MLHSKSVDDPVLWQRVEGAARWMDTTLRISDGDADVVEDWEVDELLNWSTGLDFDDYWKDWHSIATSDLSEAAVCKLFYCSQLHSISVKYYFRVGQTFARTLIASGVTWRPRIIWNNSSKGIHLNKTGK